MASPPPPAGQDHGIALPGGRFQLGPDGSAKLTVSIEGQAERLSAARLETFRALPHDLFLVPDRVSREGGEVRWEWDARAAKMAPLPGLLREWRRRPQLTMPSAFRLIRAIMRASGEVDHLRPMRFLSSPAQWMLVSANAGQPEQWMVFPFVAGKAGLREIAAAHSDTWLWLSAEEAVNGGPPDRAYLLGAALYYLLVAEPWPADLSLTQRLRRVICCQVGNASLCRERLRESVPAGLAPSALELSQLVTTLLTPAFGRPISAAQAVRQFEQLADRLSPAALAVGWDSEGECALALSMIEAAIAAQPADPIPWDLVERLRAWSGDLTGAAEAALRRPPAQDNTESSTFGGRLRDLCKRGAISEIESLFQRIDGGFNPGAGRRAGAESGPAAATLVPQVETDHLYLAYAVGCRLGRTDDALRWLKRDFTVSLDQVIKIVLESRLRLEQKRWLDVVRLARDGRKLIAGMPGQGGPHGQYTAAYLDFLDGIGHARGVADQGLPREYLNDALQKFEGVWTKLNAYGATDLQSALIRWMAWLGAYARRIQSPVLERGVEAFLDSVQAVRPTADETAPPVPWCSEPWLFASA